MAADDRTRLDEGTIDLVDNQVDQSTGTIKLKASFPNRDLHLWPGNFVNGRIVVDERQAGVTVPAAALRHGPRGDFVWVVSHEQKAEIAPRDRRPIDRWPRADRARPEAGRAGGDRRALPARSLG